MDAVALCLHNRAQVFKINNRILSHRTISAGVPQGSVLSPVLQYIPCTLMVVFHTVNQLKKIKFTDDTIIGLITENYENDDYRKMVSTMIE